jgi:hypothetical protein
VTGRKVDSRRSQATRPSSFRFPTKTRRERRETFLSLGRSAGAVAFQQRRSCDWAGASGSPQQADYPCLAAIISSVPTRDVLRTST